MAKIFHGGIKMKEKKIRQTLKKLDMKKNPQGLDRAKRERELHSRLNM